jgi:hypothetical protein
MPISRTAIAALLIAAASSAALAEDCRDERAIKSADSNKSTKVQFKNESKSRVRVFWLNYEGKREHYSDIAPGRSYSQDTFMTHPWVVTDPNGQCILLFRPLPGATLATIRTVD